MLNDSIQIFRKCKAEASVFAGKRIYLMKLDFLNCFWRRRMQRTQLGKAHYMLFLTSDSSHNQPTLCTC